MIELFAYKGCDGCRRARKWLDARGIEYQERPVRERPPTPSQLRRALEAQGQLRRLFNVSGRDYRDSGLKDRLPQLSEGEAWALLAGNGNLVKRPFLATARGAWAGFDERAWRELLNLPEA